MASTTRHRKSGPYFPRDGVPMKQSAETLEKTRSESYLMENVQEAIRLELKTDPDAVRKQAIWCGVKPGLRVLDAGCGPGKITSILHEMISPGGAILGVDYSPKRIKHAKEHYGERLGVEFRLHDLRDPLDGMGPFDLIWVRFVLEYYLSESAEIIRNLSSSLKPGGQLCLLDLDHNCLSHYKMPSKLERITFEIMSKLEAEFNFDPYAGRKLYSYLFDLGYENIQLDLRAHYLIYGEIRAPDVFNWMKKAQVISARTPDIFESYPGGRIGFFTDFIRFFRDPRRFTYTPLILCKGTKSPSS